MPPARFDFDRWFARVRGGALPGGWARIEQVAGKVFDLPVARGKSVFGSHWIRDMGHFYGTNLFLAESSATTGGLDSLLEPTGNIKRSQEMAARAFGADRAYYVTNGTSTVKEVPSAKVSVMVRISVTIFWAGSKVWA